MLCPSCGSDNPAGGKFCNECGASLLLACGACGTANPGVAKFCSECGTPLAAGIQAPVQGAVAAHAAPAAERRLVSILFADLVGFTPLAEGRDSEDVRDLLSRYFEACSRLIGLYGGTVEKFIGDAVMAVWGAPTATEDDAERAVRAALDLVAAVTALGDELGVEGLHARAGVLTGEAAVTLGAVGEGMVAGDLVNTASRVQSIAAPGQVLVSAATRRATDATVVYEEAGSHELKGKAGLITLWRALRVVSGTRGSLKSHGLEAPFVGRERELRLIKDFFHDCADQRRAHLVSITGIAGIGKSRLAWEFYKYFDGIAQVTYWHRGRCLSYGEGVTYWALADMVRMRCRIAEEEEPASALVKLREAMSEHITDPEERRFVEPRVAHLLGLEDGQGYERDDLFAAWRVFFERLTDEYPVVMVFEDMQWGDDSLLDFIEYLLEWSRSLPLFVVTLARPELQERRPSWGAGRRNFTSLFLEPLSPPAMEELLAGLVPGLPAEARAQILERAEGIPLYAVETVRMMLDRGALVQEGAVYRPTGPLELEIPETLQALIGARLDGLPPAERRVLQDAAVLGKTFTQRALAGLSDLIDDELESVLSSLVRKEVLAVQADPRSPEHGQYGFLQDLIRHVTYDTLSKRERKARHLAAAAHLESTLGEDEVVEVVASHYLDAYRAAPDADDAETIRVKARMTLARAGERAASLAAAREAQRYFEQAAELADDEVARAGFHARAARMARLRGRMAEAKALYEQALAVLDEASRGHEAALVLARLGEIDFREGHAREAVVRLERALEMLADEEPGADLAAVSGQLGRFLVLNGQHEEAAPYVERALELAEGLGLTEVFVETLTTKGALFEYRNRLAEARILLEGALARAVAEDLTAAAMRTTNNLAVILESSDLYGEAMALTDRGLEIARRTGDRLWEAIFTAGPISALVLLGRWDEAVERHARAEGIPGAEHLQNLKVHLIEIDCRRGRVAEAREQLERLNLLASDDIQSRSAHDVFEAMVLRHEGKPRAALESADRALSVLAELGDVFLNMKLALVEALESALQAGDRARVDELLRHVEALRPGERPALLDAHAHRFRGRLSGDPTAFEAAEKRFRALETTFFLAVTQLEHAEQLTSLGRGGEAEPLFEAARETFARLDARPWLERVDRRTDRAAAVAAGS
jgi:predicted ATPase/class 3 adenylate cyclase